MKQISVAKVNIKECEMNLMVQVNTAEEEYINNLYYFFEEQESSTGSNKLE